MKEVESILDWAEYGSELCGVVVVLASTMLKVWDSKPSQGNFRQSKNLLAWMGIWNSSHVS